MPEEPFRPPISLEGRYVSLVPLERAHAPGLLRASQDPEVGKYLFTPPARTVEGLARQIDGLLALQSAGTALPFCQVLRATGEPIGMTRFIQIDRSNLSVEVGGTWLDRRFWRTPLNSEGKWLLLRHAFETERFHRVWLQTDLRNERSQRAIARLGATREGVLREDRLLPSGRFRSSVVYGIVADEWPGIRARLEATLSRPWEGGEASGRGTRSGPT